MERLPPPGIVQVWLGLFYSTFKLHPLFFFVRGFHAGLKSSLAVFREYPISLLYILFLSTLFHWFFAFVRELSFDAPRRYILFYFYHFFSFLLCNWAGVLARMRYPWT